MSLVGLVLGLIGGGGAILTMPILVYLLGVSPALATSYSLFIVGSSSIIGVWRYHIQRLVDYRTAIIFVLPSLLGTYLARRVLLPAIPDIVMQWGSYVVSKDQLIMTVFAVVMLGASLSMIRPQPYATTAQTPGSYPKLLGLGLGVGFIAGFVGAGGGFLIIPALVVFGRLKMNTAVATSLFIIATNSLVAFTGDLLAHVPIAWSLLALMTAVSSVGLILGVKLSSAVSPAKLKLGFGWFVLVMGAGILYKQIF
jgi:hypothetical protein